MPKDIKKVRENLMKEHPEKPKMVDRKIELFEVGKKETEKGEDFLRQEELIREGLKREIDMMEMDETLKKEAENKAKKIQVLGEEEKIEYLLKLAKEKGLAFAIKVAREMNDPFVLDTLHDILAKEGYYQKLLK